jgi:hypothetical protein
MAASRNSIGNNQVVAIEREGAQKKEGGEARGAGRGR